MRRRTRSTETGHVERKTPTHWRTHRSLERTGALKRRGSDLRRTAWNWRSYCQRMAVAAGGSGDSVAPNGRGVWTPPPFYLAGPRYASGRSAVESATCSHLGEMEQRPQGDCSNLLAGGTVSATAAKDVLAEMFNSEASPATIVERKGLAMRETHGRANPKLVSDLLERAIGE